jgi:hypothetical protein
MLIPPCVAKPCEQGWLQITAGGRALLLGPPVNFKLEQRGLRGSGEGRALLAAQLQDVAP